MAERTFGRAKARLAPKYDPARDGLNWYGYCGNNPMSNVDFTGLEIISVQTYGPVIVAAYSGHRNLASAYEGTLNGYSANQLTRNFSPEGGWSLDTDAAHTTADFVSGGNGNHALDPGTYTGTFASVTQSTNKDLSSAAYGGWSMIYLAHLDGSSFAVHPAKSNPIDILRVYTQGCIGIIGQGVQTSVSVFNNLMSSIGADISYISYKIFGGPAPQGTVIVQPAPVLTTPAQTTSSGNNGDSGNNGNNETPGPAAGTGANDF